MEDWMNTLMNPKVISSFNNINIQPRTVTLLSGNSMAGKTVICLHHTNIALLNGYRVLYYDTEEKPFIDRPEPNLFKDFCTLNPDIYNKNFHYKTELDLDKFESDIEEIKPDMLVIDSIIQPFNIAYIDEIYLMRAKKVNEFMQKLRGIIRKHDIGVLLTTQISRVVNPTTKVITKEPKGGQGLKYLSDIKITISFSENTDSEDSTNNVRFLVIDRMVRKPFKIDDGGHITEMTGGNNNGKQELKDKSS